MPFCRECGFEVETDWLYCPKCNSSQISSNSKYSKINIENTSDKDQEIITRRMLTIDQWNDDIKELEKKQTNYYSGIVGIMIIILLLSIKILDEYWTYRSIESPETVLFIFLASLLGLMVILMMLFSPDYEHKILTLRNRIKKGRESIYEDCEE